MRIESTVATMWKLIMIYNIYPVFKSHWGDFYIELEYETLELVALDDMQCFYKVSCQTSGDY